MTRIGCIFVSLLVCSACSAPGSSAPSATHPAVVPAANSTQQQVPSSIEAALVLKQVPATDTHTPAASLKPSYPDKESFLADVKATHLPQAVVLDNSMVWDGFGPATRYHTNTDGSISR